MQTCTTCGYIQIRKEQMLSKPNATISDITNNPSTTAEKAYKYFNNND